MEILFCVSVSVVSLSDPCSPRSANLRGLEMTLLHLSDIEVGFAVGGCDRGFLCC